MNTQAYWLNEDATIRRVKVLTDEGKERIAVEVRRHQGAIKGNRVRQTRTVELGAPFYIADEDGTGWEKCTKGRGSPGWNHETLAVAKVLADLPDPVEQL